jgi:hypothetical protein
MNLRNPTAHIENDSMEWLDLELLVRAKYNDIRAVRSAVDANGVRIWGLTNLSDEMREMRQQIRNPGSHGKKIDREEAALRYDKWVKKGIARRFLAALHGEA